jgi:hypothetical protein
MLSKQIKSSNSIGAFFMESFLISGRAIKIYTFAKKS